MNLIRATILPFLLLSIINLTHAQQNDAKQAIASDKWETLSDEKYEIDYPDNWELRKTGEYNTTFLLFSPMIEVTDMFRENVNLMIQDLSGNPMDLDKFIEMSLGQLENGFVNATITTNERVKGDDQREYHKMIYLIKQEKLHLKFEQYCWMIGDEAYVLTLTCQDEQFENYRKVGERILNSFKIKG